MRGGDREDRAREREARGRERVHGKSREQEDRRHAARLEEDLRDALKYPLNKVNQLERVLFIRLEGDDDAPRRQRSAGQPGESVRGQQQEPRCDDERKRQRRHAPGLEGLGGAEHCDDRNDGAEHDVDPEQRSMGQKGCQCEPDEDAIIAVEAGRQRSRVDPQPLRRQSRHDDGEEAGDRHLGDAGGV